MHRAASADIIQVVDSELITDIVEVGKSEGKQENEEAKSDSEEDICFGVVWEKYLEDEDKNGSVIPEQFQCPFAGLIIPETEEQQDAEISSDVTASQIIATEREETHGKQEMIVGEEFIGMSVAKKFDIAGKFEVFRGKVTEVNDRTAKETVILCCYENGDGEDLNESEFREACELFLSIEDNNDEMLGSDDGKEEYNSDIEISEYSVSDEEESFLPPAKKPRPKRNHNKEAERTPRRKKTKEAEGHDDANKKQSKAIDVEALIHLGSKGSVQAKTMALMTTEQKRGDYRNGREGFATTREERITRQDNEGNLL